VRVEGLDGGAERLQLTFLDDGAGVGGLPVVGDDELPAVAARIDLDAVAADAFDLGPEVIPLRCQP
jgi:hypothetical protein